MIRLSGQDGVGVGGGGVTKENLWQTYIGNTYIDQL